jgi:hypothetical protein
MGMKMFFARLWQWFTRCSAPGATPSAVPYVPLNPAGPGNWSNGLPFQPLERNVEVYSISGLKIELSQMERRCRSVDGEIIRLYENRRQIIGSCGHTLDATPSEGDPEKNPHHRKIAGQCVYCLREYQPLVEKGQMDPLEAERLSLICPDCARMSTSGRLCCPRHRKAVVMRDGATQYLDPDTAKSMARQDTIAKALHVVTWLFAEPQNPQEHKTLGQE